MLAALALNFALGTEAYVTVVAPSNRAVAAGRSPRSLPRRGVAPAWTPAPQLDDITDEEWKLLASLRKVKPKPTGDVYEVFGPSGEWEEPDVSLPFMDGVESGAEMSGSDLLVAALELGGVTRTFGYPGGASLELHQSLLRSSKLRNVLCRHEQGEVFAAEGYAKCTGRAGVAIATSGPGATNLITGIADAFCDSVPLLCITGQVPEALIGLNSFQEMPVVDLVRPITKKVYQITDVKEVAATVLEALFVAESGRPGPVLIDFPKNIQQAMAKAKFSANTEQYFGQSGLVVGGPKKPVPLDAAGELMERLRLAQRPLLYVGGGCVQACEQLQAFIAATGIPVVQTLMALGCVPASSPTNLGMLGMHGTMAANYAVHNADMLIALGARFDDRVTGKVEKFAQHAFIAHVDVDPKEIGKIKAVQMGINADVGDVLTVLNVMLAHDHAAHRLHPDDTDDGTVDGALPTRAQRAWVDELRAEDAKCPMTYHTKEIGGKIRPEYAISLLSDMVKQFIPDPKNVVVTTGVGQHQMWAAQHFKFETERRWLTSGGLGSMGFGLPAAIGAAFALPHATVIDIDGDGSFQMNIQELAVAAIEKLNTKIVILNNQFLGMVFQWENTFYNKQHAHSFTGNPETPDVPYPDFVAIANGYGIAGARVFTEDEMIAAYETMLTTPGPFVLDLVCADNHVYPMIPSGKSFADIMCKDLIDEVDET